MENELQLLIDDLERDLESLQQSIPSFNDDEYEEAITIKEKMSYIRSQLENVTAEVNECIYKLDEIEEEMESEDEE